MLLCACTFYVNRLDLGIFTCRYTYLPKIPIYRNIYTYNILYILYVYVQIESRQSKARSFSFSYCSPSAERECVLCNTRDFYQEEKKNSRERREKRDHHGNLENEIPSCLLSLVSRDNPISTTCFPQSR